MPENLILKWLIVLIFISLIFSVNAYPQSVSDIKLPEVDKKITAWMNSKNVPGLTACIVKHNRIVWSRGYGWANIEEKKHFTPDKTLFHIASVSKTFTATAIMQLWEKGHFQLDDDINNYLPFSVRNPEYPDKPITFRHLLTHTSSIHDTGSLYDTYLCGDPIISLKKFVSGYFFPDGDYWKRKNFKNNHAPGEKEEYANAGFALLGYLIEEISKMSLENYMQAHIFMPLGMQESSFYITNLDISKHALPYTYTLKVRKKLIDDGDGNLLQKKEKPKIGYNAHCLYSYPTLADGMIRTSVHQLARFLMAYMNNGSYKSNRILKTETVKKMLTGQNNAKQGLCWYRSGTTWGHDGGDPGCSTEMWFDYEDNVGVIIFCNSDKKLQSITKLLLKVAKEKYGSKTNDPQH